MRYVIKKYGFTKELLDKLSKINNIELIYASEPDLKNEMFFCGLNLLSSYKAVKCIKDGEADGFLINSAIEYNILRSMIEELRTYGLKDEYIYLLRKDFNDYPHENNIVRYRDYHHLPYVEYHVANHCNLNCSGCVHFSPLVKEKKFPDFDSIYKDLKQLNKIVYDIDEIHILGGEPLLNPELERYILATRELYPYTRIIVVTNGLLIRTMSDSLIESIRKNNAEIAISLYKPMFSHIDDVLSFLNENQISYHCSKPIAKFAYTFTESGGHANGVRVLNCSCPNLHNGKLYICPPIAYSSYFNNEFGGMFHISEEEGGIDIYDDGLSYEDFMRKLHKPVSVCDYCLYISREDAIFFDWKQTDAINIADYIFKEC